ncbi:uncharacterized protein LOC131660925 [Vicia villosa]|uniref:uncharacterized protein LOC131660925 n=1 Tax=Vicia villosa TaxID=3911 RepID=UPI00273CA5A7|nr:uncharacterized protein LOC131660925 [Vicia villosa]
MSVLVNGSPTREFSVSRGLSQGDLLSPFLFLLVVVGLTGMVKVASYLGDFKGFSLDDHNHFEILQFADDTILIGEDSWNNLWTFKAILRGFELVSRLRVNLNKSRLFGVNLDPIFIQVGSFFLNCDIGSSSFVFLGILAMKTIVKEIISIRRSFFWGGDEDKKKISWDKVCLSKGEGGLSMKNCGKYGNIQRAMLKALSLHLRSKVSLWWKDLCSIGCADLGSPSNWFKSSISCKIGMGLFLEFWFDVWIGTTPLGIIFPDLFLLTDAPHSKVADIGSSNGDNSPRRFLEDSFVWWRNISGFMVSNVYDVIMLCELPRPPLDESLSLALSRLWKSKVPSRIHLFGWRLI